jgi:DNA invertase Pin-like site-specific DNA recombinase
VTDKKLIGSARVSTSQQGRSGLGLEAQKNALERIAEAEGFMLAHVFVEVETGKAPMPLSGVHSVPLH